MAADKDRFWKLIDDVQTCMMVTEGGGTPGEPNLTARPMQAIADPANNRIWFYTAVVSGKTNDLAKDSEVCLAFSDPSKGDYVSVTGQAQVVQDKEMIHRHWSKFVDAWFPEGPDGPNVGMIRVDVTAGEYWDSQSSRVVAAVKMFMASERNTRPDMGDNEKVKFG